MAAASEFGVASMSMLGNSVFAAGDTDNLERTLSDFGKTCRCSVDVEGPRVIHR
jgi:pantoate kinase